MPDYRLSLGASILAVFLAACGSTNSAAPGGDGGSDATTSSSGGSTPLPCDVTAVLQANCQSCHQNPPINSAPMPLVTWEDTQAVVPNDPDGIPPTSATEKVYQMIETRITSASNPMPPLPHAALDAADLATLTSWVNAGAPAGTAGQSCVGVDGGGVPDGNAPALECNNDDTTLAPASDFDWDDTVDAGGTDVYVCYSVTLADITDGGQRHIFGITPNIDNRSIVHHVLLFEADPADTSVTNTPAPCNPAGSALWRMIYGWAPGGGAMQTPQGVGFPYDATTQFVVQVHYNNLRGLTGQTDHTGFSMCTTDETGLIDADVMAFGTQHISIPAHGELDQTCSITVPSLFAGVHAFAAFPHMHTLGTAIQTEQVLGGGGGGIVEMGENVPWNFNTQLMFPVEATLNEGDVIRTRCAWTNPTDQTVGYGYYTEDEMCYSFTSYYPKVPSSLWSWDLPALQSTCATTPAGGLPTPDAGWTAPPDSGLVFDPEEAGTWAGIDASTGDGGP
jgi:hypothetical protein